MIQRHEDLAHVPDYESIPDTQLRGYLKRWDKMIPQAKQWPIDARFMGIGLRNIVNFPAHRTSELLKHVYYEDIIDVGRSDSRIPKYEIDVDTSRLLVVLAYGLIRSTSGTAMLFQWDDMVSNAREALGEDHRLNQYIRDPKSTRK